MYKYFSLLFLSISVFGLSAQENLYRVYFSDKGENIEMLTNPSSFLSGKAIWRRAKHNISINQTDLPVSKKYKATLSNYGTLTKNYSKWMNYQVLSTTENQISLIENLSFVKKVEKVKMATVAFADAGCATNAFNYGAGTLQIEMVKGNELHDFGFTGAGMTIAVLDGGFAGADTSNPGFDSLYIRKQILGSYDFVNGDTDVFEGGNHGALVLSVMGGFIDNAMIGSAPDASYWLLKSENEANETTVEMDNWVRAAEFADSVGADVINSSLGYSTFDGGQGNLTQADMDGNTAVVTIGADMAAAKGILVVVSAGNGGASGWPIISAPADGDSVMAVGGVNGNGEYVIFASRGPSADGRVKPDVVGMAQGTTLIFGNGNVQGGNGTSFSSPLIAGLATCLWQSKPSLSNMDIYQAIITNSSHYFTPNAEVGFGLPNFASASYSINLVEKVNQQLALKLYPNPAADFVEIEISGLKKAETFRYSVLNMAGQKIMEKEVFVQPKTNIRIDLPNISGLYLVSLSGETAHFAKEIIVQ